MVRGSLGKDRIRTGDGDDEVSGGGDSDGIATGGGDDTIDVRDGLRDRVYCGGGADTVYADPADILRGCETVILARPPAGSHGGRRGLTPSAP